MKELKRRLCLASWRFFLLRSRSLNLYSSMNPRNGGMTGPVCRVGQSVSLDTKSEATAKLHTACATVRNRKKRTIIIKYHHFVTFKGIWKYFPPILLLVFVCQCLLSLFFRYGRNSRTNQSRVETGSLWWGGGLPKCLCYLPPTSLSVIK